MALLIPPQLRAHLAVVKLISIVVFVLGAAYLGWYFRDLQAAKDALKAEQAFSARLEKELKDGQDAVDAERAQRMEYKGQVDALSKQLRDMGVKRDETLGAARDSISRSRLSGTKEALVYELPIPPKDYSLWLNARALAESPASSASSPSP